MKSKTKKAGTRKNPKRGFAMLDREKARKDAPVAIRALRRIVTKARADLSVSLVICNRLDHALDLVEEELNELLPPPGSRPEARLPFDEECQPICEDRAELTAMRSNREPNTVVAEGRLNKDGKIPHGTL